MKRGPRAISAAMLALTAMMAAIADTEAGDCEGRVVGVRALAQYDHARGNGFLAVRTGPGRRYRQVGELYRGDLVAVYRRRGNWYEVGCLAGTCEAPLWGAAYPSGWVHGRYLRVDGLCP